MSGARCSPAGAQSRHVRLRAARQYRTSVEGLSQLTVFSTNKQGWVTLDQVVAESDYLSVHIPATPETKHIFNKQMFAKMKPTAFFINTSRGALGRSYVACTGV